MPLFRFIIITGAFIIITMITKMTALTRESTGQPLGVSKK